MMPLFRKKPVVIEARQWTGNNAVTLLDWMNEGRDAYQEGASLFIKTLEGDHEASLGDWIIKGVHGEFYPCKPDIFEKTYETVQTEDQPNEAKNDGIVHTMSLQSQNEALTDEKASLVAEIAGLKSLVKDGIEYTRNQADEIARLREALETICEQDPISSAHIARAALEAEPSGTS